MKKTLEVNDQYIEKISITSKMVNEYSKITGDFNPLHWDIDYCAKTRFGKPIVHGMFLAGILSKVIGVNFPGPGTIYHEQILKFVSPVYINEECIISIKVIDIDDEIGYLTLETKITSAEMIRLSVIAKVFLINKEKI